MDLKEEMHRRGINMRLLGVVWEAVFAIGDTAKGAEKAFWLNRIAVEIVLRASRPVLAALMQRAMQSIKYHEIFQVCRAECYSSG